MGCCNSRKSKTQEQIKQEKLWTDAFKIFDKTNTGQINTVFLGKVLRVIGRNPTQSEVQSIIKKLDKDGRGVIQLDKFIQMMKTLKKDSLQTGKSEMLEAFRAIDTDNDGIIDIHQLLAVLTSMGEPLSVSEVEAVVMTADEQTNGKVRKGDKICYAELVNVLLAPPGSLTNL